MAPSYSETDIDKVYSLIGEYLEHPQKEGLSVSEERGITRKALSNFDTLIKPLLEEQFSPVGCSVSYDELREELHSSPPRLESWEFHNALWAGAANYQEVILRDSEVLFYQSPARQERLRV